MVGQENNKYTTFETQQTRHYLLEWQHMLHGNICFIIDIVVGFDVNITKNINLKHDNYMQLSSELKRLCPNLSFEIEPIVLGATGLVT